MEKFEIQPQKIKIPERVIAARMGFRGIGRIPQEFKKVYDDVYSLAMKIAKPQAVVEDHVVLSSNEEGVEIDELKIKGKLALSQLSKSVKISALLVTLGKAIDEEVSYLHESGEELASFMLDSIGSELVEYTARFVDGILREKRKLKGSARISPGYVDLPLSLNLWFAKKMGKEISVVCDEESFIFIPRKTISAFIGWSN